MEFLGNNNEDNIPSDDNWTSPGQTVMSEGRPYRSVPMGNGLHLKQPLPVISERPTPTLSQKVGRGFSSLWNRAKAVGHNLKQPETIAQSIPSAAVGMLTKAVATHGLSALAGATIGATAGGLVAAAGIGAALSTVTGHLRSEFNKAKLNNSDLKAEGSWLKRLGTDSWNFTKFSARHVATGAIKDTLKEEWKNDKRGMLMRGGLGAVFGALGYGATHGLGHSVATAASTPAPVAPVIDHHILTPDIKHAPIVSAADIAPPQTALQKAVQAILNDNNASETAKTSAREALKGHAWAQNNVAYYLNNAKDGVDLDQNLAHDVLKEIANPGNKGAQHMLSQIKGHKIFKAFAQKPAVPVAPVVLPVVPAPHLDTVLPNLNDSITIDGQVVAQAAVETAKTTAAETTKTVLETTAAVGAAAGTVVAAAPAVQGMVMAGALATAQPEKPAQVTAPAAVATQPVQAPFVVHTPEEKAHCHFSIQNPYHGQCVPSAKADADTMRANDYVRVTEDTSGLEIGAGVTMPEGQKEASTIDFIQQRIFSKSSDGSPGRIASLFNSLISNTKAVNDNTKEIEQATAPRRLWGFGPK